MWEVSMEGSHNRFSTGKELLYPLDGLLPKEVLNACDVGMTISAFIVFLNVTHRSVSYLNPTAFR
jgi:hypothetical protein